MGTPTAGGASSKPGDHPPDGGFPGKETWREFLLIPATVLLWAIVNSQLLVLNKLFVHFIPASSFLLLVHTIFCSGVIEICKRMGFLEADDLDMHKMRVFIPIVLSFVGTLYTNLKVLERLNVDTFVCFRASLPLALSVIEPVFLGRRLPTLRSFSALVGIVCGVVIYVGNDKDVDLWGFIWLGLWFVMTVYETLVVKHVINTVEMTTWGRSFYQNVLSIPLCAVLMVVNNEKETLKAATWDAKIVAVLVASAAVGIGMSALSFKVREMVSVTAFSVAGNVAKVGTILVNCLMWEKHASPTSLAGLALALAGCGFYRQAPMREPGEALLAPLLRPFQDGGGGALALVPTSPGSVAAVLATAACMTAAVYLGGGGRGGASASPSLGNSQGAVVAAGPAAGHGTPLGAGPAPEPLAGGSSGQELGVGEWPPQALGNVPNDPGGKHDHGTRGKHRLSLSRKAKAHHAHKAKGE